MVVAPTGSGFRDDDVEKSKAAPAASPADERKKMLEDLMKDDPKSKRDVLSKELVKEVEEKGKSEKEKIALLASVLDKKQQEAIHQAVETLKTSPEEVNEEKAAALRFMRETVPYLFSILALRYELKETKELSAYVALLPKVQDPEEKELLGGVSFLSEHPDLETSRYFSTNQLPEIMADAKVLTQAARDAIDATKGEGVGTWMKDQMAKHPVAAGAFMLLGTFAAYEAGKGLYRMVKGDSDVAAVKEPNKPGLLGSLTEGWSFLTKAAVSTAVFGGGCLIAGHILGNEYVEKYLKEHHLSFLYDYRLTAAMIKFCQGDFAEGLATWNFGPRDSEAKRRHEVYATQFGVTDEAIWLMAGAKYDDLMEAEADRAYPVATGFFANIPILQDYFKMPDQVGSENKVIEMLRAHEKEIDEKIPDNDDMTLDEVLKKAFALDILTPKESEAYSRYGSDLQGLIADREAKSKAFAERMTEVGGKKEISSKDKETLAQAELQVGQELDELRLATPGYWTTMMGLIANNFPSLVVKEGEIQDLDRVKARDFYKSFAEKASESDLDAIGKDVAELGKIQRFTDQLKVGEALSASDQALLAQYTKELARINSDVDKSLVRAKTTQHQEIEEDLASTTFTDATDAGKMILWGYAGIFYGFGWGLEKTFGENQDLEHRMIGLSAVTGTAAMGISAGYGAYMISTSTKAADKLWGLAHVLCPPVGILDVRELYFTFLKDPGSLFEAVLKGLIKPERAEKICNYALKHEHLFSNTTLGIGPWFEHRMEYFKVLKDVFSNRSRLQWLEDVITGKSKFVRGSLQAWQEGIVNLVEKRMGLKFEDYLAKIARDRGAGRIILDALDKLPFMERMSKYFEMAAKRFGELPIPKPVVERLFAAGGAGIDVFMYVGRKGLPPAVAYLATYYICKDTYDAKDKSEKLPLFVMSLLIHEGIFRGSMAGARAYAEVMGTGDFIAARAAAGLTAGVAEVTGTVAVAESGVAAGAEAAMLAPKHPLVVAVVALLAAFGVSIVAEKLLAPYLKDPTLFSTTVRGIGAPVLYTAGAGQLIDTAGHYYNATNTTEKEYFTRTIYLPLLGEKKMAFRDGDVGYFNDMSPEDAVEVWNYQVREKISTLKKEDEKLRIAGKSPAHAKEIAELDEKIIDKDWVSRQIATVEGKKGEISARGQSLNENIQKKYGPSMSPVERRLVESLLTVDAPESWFDEEFCDIEEDKRVALVRKFAHALDQDAEFDTFIERKREIFSDIMFYRSIKVDEKVMHPTEKDKLVACLGINPKHAEQAEDLYQEMSGWFTSEEKPAEEATQKAA